MLKLNTALILFALITHHEAFPQTKWSRSISSSHGQLIRERRQFPFGEWIPINQQCPTCRPFADPLDVELRGDSIGLTPPRPPTTRQIHAEGNFFNQDESSILSVPPPPPKHPITNNKGNFQNLQFSDFPQQFNSPLPVPTQQVFPQTPQIQFLTQSFLPNQQLLVNNNQQVLPVLNNVNTLFGQENKGKQQLDTGNVVKFNTDFKTPKLPENVVLEQNKGLGVQQQQQQSPQFFNKPTPFTLPQHQQQIFSKQQQQHSNKIGDSILTPPPVSSNGTQQIVIPGLDKEEIQLLYVPVETLRQRGNFQEQLLTQQSPNIQFNKRPSPSPLSPTSFPTTEATNTKIPKGHFVTQNVVNQQQAISTLKVTPTESFPSTVTSSPILLQQVSLKQTPQPFLSATPPTPTIQSFITSTPQKFSAFTPETTLPQLITIPNNVKFGQSNVGFVTTPKVISNQEALQDQINDEKSQLLNSKGQIFQNVPQQRPLQQQKPEFLEQQFFTNQQHQSERQNQQSSPFRQQQQKELEFNNRIPNKQTSFQNQQEQQLLLKQQKEKELHEQYLLKQRQQKELEEQALLQREKELEEQRLLQEKIQKELERQQFLQQQRQKELEEQRYLQEKKQKELEQQQILQQQREKELENQRRLQLQRQQELEEKRRLQQLKQKEEEQRLLYFQRQQQKELEEQRLLKQQEQLLQKQKQENFKKQQQIPFYQQQPKPQIPQQPVFQQPNRHTLPANDKLNSVSQLEKESSPEVDQQLIPHQPPLSVFYKSDARAEPQIIDVLRELRRSNVITVLDQYFDQMPKVFVGPAGLVPPAGYGKFELPYLSNLETNRIERKIDRLPFFVAPLNFVPPPGYAKIPFPAPHVGSVVVSSETNPAMKLQSIEKENNAGTEQENVSESFPMVGPELPGLINNLETKTTTPKSISFPSTPSLPQTTAQIRNRRPNSNLYRTQNRKPISKPRPQTTSKPEEVVTVSTPKIEQSKDSESGFKKPFNRFLQRRRQQAKTTTENSVKSTQEGKTLENRHYSVEVYHQQKNTNQLPKKQKNDAFQDHRFNGPSQHEIATIDRSTPGDTDVFEVSPTPGLSKETSIDSGDRKLYISDNVRLQTFEDGPLPTGSAKTITQTLYRPQITKEQEFKGTETKEEGSHSSEQFNYPSLENQEIRKPTELSNVNPTATVFGVSERDIITEDIINNPPTASAAFDKQNASQKTPEQYFYATDLPRTESPFLSSLATIAPQQQQASGIEDSEQYTSVFAEISKHHHIPSSIENSDRESQKFSEPQPTSQISVNLQEPNSGFPQRQPAQEFSSFPNTQPTQINEFSNGRFDPIGTSSEKYLPDFNAASKNEETPNSYVAANTQASPIATGVSPDQFTTHFPLNSGQQEIKTFSEEEQAGTFEDSQNKSNAPIFESPSSTVSSDEYVAVTESSSNQTPNNIDPKYSSVTPEGISEITENLYRPIYKTVSEDSVQINNEEPTTENRDENSSNGVRLKIPNPSIVRVRTRVKGKSRGQLNFASSQSTTQPPLYRTYTDTKSSDKEEEHVRDINKDYQPTKTTKYNQYRGLKKGIRTTTEATNDEEQKVSVYTIRPQRRPANPSTVSTKRIRRPTTPVATIETATESFGISTQRPYYQSENSELSPSGFSNDVYYEHTSLTPVRQKFRKHFSSAEQKSDFLPGYSSTAFPTTAQEHFAPPTFVEDYADKEVDISKDLSPVAAVQQENSERYPEWIPHPSESTVDVSQIILTTVPTNNYEEQDVEEPKKFQDSKKASDPDLEKKSGRRRVRVRVHKRPHENFETAESQNLRTVANALVPPTSTYKPNDEINIHKLAKNSDFSFGGPKSFGHRSREYFRKRLNISQIEADIKQELGNKNKKENFSLVLTDEDVKGISGATDALESVNKTASKIDDDNGTVVLSEVSEGTTSKTLKPKQRGFVRKVIKHKISTKVTESPEPAANENERRLEGIEDNLKQENKELNETGKLHGSRQRTIIRYVKKNKIKPHEVESQEKSSPEEPIQKEESEPKEINQKEEVETTENVQNSKSYSPSESENYTEHSKITDQPKEIAQTLSPVYQREQQSNDKLIDDFERTQTQAPFISQTKKSAVQDDPQNPVPDKQEPGIGQLFRNSYFASKHQESGESSSTEVHPQSLLTETTRSSTQKTRFYQTPRTLYQKSSFSGFQSSKETERQSFTTEKFPEFQEKRDGPIRPKFGRFGVFGVTETSQAEEIKRINDFQTEQQIKNKNLHTLEVRKYLRTKSREGAFSQFSKNRYFTSEKTETVSTTKENNSQVKESEETTTPVEETSSQKIEDVNIKTTLTESKPETTTTVFVKKDSNEQKSGQTKINEDAESNVSVTEEIRNSSEEETTEEETTEEDDNVSTNVVMETTTPIKTESPTTIYTSNADLMETTTEWKPEEETTTEKIEVEQTEIQPDLYRFSKSSFSFDEAEKFTGTQNRAYVRNITTDIIENTASFSAPGVEKRIVPQKSDEDVPPTTESRSEVTFNEKTEETSTQQDAVETTTSYSEINQPETETDTIPKGKIAKFVKTSTTTKISHETEICYKGKCIRTKSENPDEDLKLLVDSSSIKKVENFKT